MPDRELSISVSTKTILQAILLVLLVYVLFYLRDLVLIVLTAIVLASAVEPGAAWFIRRRIPRVFSVLLVYLIVFGIVIGVFYLFIPALLSELSNFLTLGPQHLESINVT